MHGEAEEVCEVCFADAADGVDVCGGAVVFL